jgi:hypothetical protein
MFAEHLQAGDGKTFWVSSKLLRQVNQHIDDFGSEYGIQVGKINDLDRADLA